MKRDITEPEDQPLKRRKVSPATETHIQSFSAGLFDDETRTSFRGQYKSSGPYPHAVVPSLIQESLLRSVRSEIKAHIHFTQKETDIYRIYQSGDLANLSNLDAESLKHLPSLVKLRDALYSPDFREWVSYVTGAGKVSGKKTDMAVNVYTPGSYLLCHDDVIGSRRVSYILYLTDPEHPWQPEWGGGLRLYPTELRKNKAGEDIKVPLTEHSLNIPPSFGQLSFFAVRPGESYHDVEEVYHGDDHQDVDGGRIRMAVSGWFHIPQEGEDGFEEGIEQTQAQRSSLAQLEGAANEFDEPQLAFRHYDEPRTVTDSTATRQETDPGDNLDTHDDILTEQDLTFLLRYISPSYLTPDMIEDFSASFGEMSVLQLDQFFNPKFAEELKNFISACEQDSNVAAPVKGNSSKSHPANWPVARPPQKHRYAYLQSTEELHSETRQSPIDKILTDLLHSHAFKKWLALVTGLKTRGLVRQNAVARRFRRGKDYALANPYQGEQPQLEFTVSMTPSSGWERDEDDGPEEPAQAANGTHTNGEAVTNGKGKAKATDHVQVETGYDIEFGGEETYLAGDDEEEEENAGSADSKPLPSVGKKADPAVYKSSAGEDDDDGILFSNSPGWNQFCVVLRDRGVLRFVKYVSQAARGDRWDIKGEVQLDESAFEEGEEVDVGDLDDGRAPESDDDDDDDVEEEEFDDDEDDEDHEDE